MRTLADWTNQNILDLIYVYEGCDAIDLNTVKGWSSKNATPKGIYREAFLNLIQENTVPQYREVWLEAFHTCWGLKAAGLTQTNHDQAIDVNKALNRHEKWINEIYSKPIMGESFSLEQIYVPLKIIAYGVETGLEERTQIFESDILSKFAISGFTKSDDVNGIEANPSWIFIKGGPGSGKSVLALSLAQALTQTNKVTPIFTRLNRKNCKKTTSIN